MSSVCELIKKYQLISYFVLAFAITWAVFCVLVNIAAVIVILAGGMWEKLPGDHEAVYK